MNQETERVKGKVNKKKWGLPGKQMLLWLPWIGGADRSREWLKREFNWFKTKSFSAWRQKLIQISQTHQPSLSLNNDTNHINTQKRPIIIKQKARMTSSNLPFKSLRQWYHIPYMNHSTFLTWGQKSTIPTRLVSQYLLFLLLGTFLFPPFFFFISNKNSTLKNIRSGCFGGFVNVSISLMVGGFEPVTTSWWT